MREHSLAKGLEALQTLPAEISQSPPSSPPTSATPSVLGARGPLACPFLGNAWGWLRPRRTRNRWVEFIPAGAFYAFVHKHTREMLRSQKRRVYPSNGLRWETLNISCLLGNGKISLVDGSIGCARHRFDKAECCGRGWFKNQFCKTAVKYRAADLKCKNGKNPQGTAVWGGEAAPDGHCPWECAMPPPCLHPW